MRTRNYLLRRGWRTMRRLGIDAEPDFIPMALGVLSTYDDRDAVTPTRFAGRTIGRDGRCSTTCCAATPDCDIAARKRPSIDAAPVVLSKGRRSTAIRVLSAQGKAPRDGFWQAPPAAVPVLGKTQAQLIAEKTAAREEVSGTPSRASGEIDPSPSDPPALTTVGGSASGLIVTFQLGVSVVLSVLTGNAIPFVVALRLAILSLRMRRPNWGIFPFAMVILWLMLHPG